MSKRTTFTTITPLPPGISRQVVINFLQDHEEMIDLNPLVKERHPIHPPSHAAADELRCIWYSMTDRISYLPGKMATGEVTYTCVFNNLPTGIQTHCYAPAGLDIRDRWTVNGSLPGEPVERIEIGLKGAPLTGLYIREDVDMTCNIIMTPFVKKTLKDSHAALIQRLKLKAELASAIHAVSHRASDSIRSISSVETVDRSKNLSVYNTGNSRHQRSSSHCSIASSVSSCTSPPPASYKNMVVSPPTPPYSPMASSLWSQLQPPQSTTTLASLSQPRRSLEKYGAPKPALIPEPLRIPRPGPTQGSSHPHHQAEINKPSPSSFHPSPRRKFSYDSTSSTENYLVTSAAARNNNDTSHVWIQPPVRISEQHILLQSREHHQQRISLPQQKQSNLQGRYEEHPDYPHMSPYMNSDDDVDDYHYGKDDKGQSLRRQEKAEVVVNDNDSGYADYLPPSTRSGATLDGPFVAAFDEFNICLP